MDSDEFASLGEPQFLTVRIAAEKGSSERLMLIGAPYDGQVRVREWDSNSLNTSGDDYDIDPAELLEEIERAYGSATQVTPEIYEIRRWLGGL